MSADKPCTCSSWQLAGVFTRLCVRTPTLPHQDAGPSQHAAAAFDSSSSSSEAAIQHQQQQPSTQQLQASSPPQPLQQQQQQDAPSSLLHQQVLFEMPPAGQPLPRLPRFRPRKAQQQPVPVMEALSMVKVCLMCVACLPSSPARHAI